MAITLRMWTVNVIDQWCQWGGYWTSHTFLTVLKVQQSLCLRWFLLKVAFSNSKLQYDSSTGVRVADARMSMLCGDTSTDLFPQRLYCQESDSVMTPG